MSLLEELDLDKIIFITNQCTCLPFMASGSFIFKVYKLFKLKFYFILGYICLSVGLRKLLFTRFLLFYNSNFFIYILCRKYIFNT